MKIFAIAVVLAGCASTSANSASTSAPREESVTGDLGNVRLHHDDTGITTEYDSPRAKVWQALLDVHRDLELPLVGADPATGVLAFFLQSYNHRIADKRASA